MQRMLWCFAHGSNRTGWEAVCVDLDIAVEARTFEAAKAALESAICSYVEDALQEAPADRARLLRRRAPWFVRLGCWAKLAWHAVTNRRRDDDQRAGFDVLCPA
ncbi:hypothetical protein Q0812_13245 [Brevundimonas sp. 2R-24]|uniref:HicB-like antitoxin of toxin-antitoxin system domain-containing protein n=1 Tax=Peiella sedimenti TaxID=3061083 RepID=A0ABT8SPH3_9CAUL|nr:hypothetical protein [Caulobacteraceae bacterium XZ-24]